MTAGQRTPVLIGGGQKTWRKASAPGPRAMLREAVSLAAADAGLQIGVLAEADTIGVVGFTVDAPGTARRLSVPRLANPPAALAEDLGASPRVAVYTSTGGNSPQALVNWACERIAEGEADLVVLAGAEFLGTLMQRLGAGEDLSMFGGGPESPREQWGQEREGCTPQEEAHGVSFPANIYPMFENALRAKLERSIDAHQRAMGALFQRFNAVAATNPHAWFPKARTAEEIATEGPDNRMVGFPYTKYLNAIIRVDQAAAVILASSACADRLGVPAARRVYLHGCGDANEIWNPIEREDLAAAPAIGMLARHALDMAQVSIGDVALFDIYSCFPSAVEIACREIGIAEDDRRPLTVTGGLPYFGGPGNNYVMHSIVSMMERLRAQPGKFGMVTANGWYLTKHAVGVYSATPPAKAFRRDDPKTLQAKIEARARPEIVWEPEGRATVETYTIVHGRDDVRMGIVYGRDAQNRRFIANLPEDKALLRGMQTREGVGQSGTVVSGEGGMQNVFTPD